MSRLMHDNHLWEDTLLWDNLLYDTIVLMNDLCNGRERAFEFPPLLMYPRSCQGSIFI